VSNKSDAVVGVLLKPRGNSLGEIVFAVLLDGETVSKTTTDGVFVLLLGAPEGDAVAGEEDSPPSA
jgi:hypothetical protein